MYTVGVYAVRPLEMADVHDAGFNMIHTYEYFGQDFSPAGYLDAAKANNLAVLMPARDEASAKAIARSDIKSLIDMPEELRIWKQNEKDSLESRSALARSVRTTQARTYKYVPWAYSKDKAETFAYLHNAFGVSLYWEQFCETGQALYRRLEEYQDLIESLDKKNSASIRSKKFGIVGTYDNRPEQCKPTAQGSALAFWGAVGFGYDGVFVFSYAYRHKCPEAWQSVLDQLQQLRGIELVSSKPVVNESLRERFVAVATLTTRGANKLLLVNFSNKDQTVDLRNIASRSTQQTRLVVLEPQSSKILPWE